MSGPTAIRCLDRTWGVVDISAATAESALASELQGEMELMNSVAVSTPSSRFRPEACFSGRIEESAVLAAWFVLLP